MNPGSEIEFDIRTPVADDGLVRQVSATLARGFPEVDLGAERVETLTIVANGPSAALAPLVGPTLALNGALRLFERSGVAPTYWAACDPQEMVADFIPDNPPMETTYLVASKCHPSVFDKLRNRKVIVWHVSEDAARPVLEGRLAAPSFVSVTLTIFAVMELLGFRKFETWGWDGCYLDGKDHAIPQAHPTGTDIRLEVGDQTFSTTHAWALEAQTASQLFGLYPRDLKIRGGGLIGAILAYTLDGGEAYL